MYTVYRTTGAKRPSATRSLLILSLVLLMLVQGLSLVQTAGPGMASAATSRIIIVSNQTSIPLALGMPSAGLSAFTGVLTNMKGVHITGQVVDGNYTPLWQPGSAGNHGIGDAQVHWSFGDEPARAHSIAADRDGYFTFFLTPEVQAPATAQLRFWFDGKSDTVYGIPIYPPAEIIYDVVVSESVYLTVVPAQTRAMAGDTILVQGTLRTSDGLPAAGEGLIASMDGRPTQTNPHAGWFVDDVILGPLVEDFENGLGGFTAGGKGTWAAGTPTAGPMSGFSSFGCAGSALGGGYAYDTDGWLTSPTVDLSGTDQATLLFGSWSDVAKDDQLIVELSNDNGLTWPVRVTVDPGATWTPVAIPVGTFTGTAYGTVQFAHRPEVMFRFRLIGHTMPIITAADGSYEFTYKVSKDKAASPAVIWVEHPASNDFAGTAATATIDIARGTWIETMEPDAVYRGVPAEARARLLDTDGSPMRTSFPGQQVPRPTVMFWLRQGDKETYLGERPLDKDGYSAIGLEADRSGQLGPAQVRYAFAGNEFYAPVEAMRDMVFKAHTEVDITSPRTASLLAQDSLEVAGDVKVVSLESSYANVQDPITKKDVQVYLDGVLLGTATTDGQGHFSLTHDVRGVDIGSAIIRVAFPGDLVYEPSEATVDFGILSNTGIQAIAKSVKKGTTATIDGSLTSIGGGLQGIVEVSIDGNLYRKVSTGASGGFAVSYDVPWTADAGPMPVTLTYRGSKVYRPTTTTVNFTVESDTMLVVPKEVPAGHRGAGVTMKGTLVDSWGDVPGLPIPGVQVDLTLPDGTFATAMTNMNGNFTYYYTVPASLAVGDTDVLASFSGPYRGPSTVVMPLRVTSQTTLSFAEVGPMPLSSGSQVVIKVILTDDASVPVAGRVLTVVTSSPGAETVLFEGPTDSAGALVFTAVLNGTGSQTLTVRFKGDDHYEASMASDYISLGPAPKVTTPVQRQPTIVLGGGLSLILVLTMVLTESGKYFLFKWILVPMYSKLKKEDVLDHFVRGQIYGLIRLQPGAHYNFIKKKLDLKNGVLSYHLSTLEREGYVLSEMDGIYRRFYPNSVKFEVDYPIFLSKLQERIVDFIKSRPGLTQKEVAKELGISTSTANDNIQVLSQALILALKRDGKRTRCYLVDS